MNIGADIPLYQHEDLLQEVLEFAREPGTHLYLAGQRHPKQTFSVTNYCEKHYLTSNVSFFPYYDVCRNFPLLKKDCHIWFDKTGVSPSEFQGVKTTSKHKRVLFATMFHPLKNEGNSVVIRYWLELFHHQGYEIHLLYYGIDARDIRNKKQSGDAKCYDKIFSIPVTSYSTSANSNGLNVHVDDWCGLEVISKVKELVAQYPYDICFTNYTFFTAIFEYCHSYTEKILLTHDSFLDRNRKILAQGFSESGWMSLDAEGEKLACSRADKIIALQEKEAAYFTQISPPTKQVITIPPLPSPVELVYPPQSSDKLVLGYIGSSNFINEENLSLFVRAVAKNPTLQDKISLRIAGGVSDRIYDFCSPNEFATLEHTLLGQVPSLHDFYAACDVIINPERGGTGIKIKTLDAMAHGAALVCTAGAAEGTGALSSFHNAKSIPDMLHYICKIVEHPCLIDELRQESKTLYRTLMAKYKKKAEHMLTSSSTVITKGIPLVREGKNAYLHSFEKMLRHTSVKNKNIIEIGSDPNIVMAQLCIANGASSVCAYNPWLPKKDEIQHPNNLLVFQEDFANCQLPPHSVDLIFCIATLEHLIDIEEIAIKIVEVLKPDGQIYLQGEPFWSCGNGHHLWAADNVSIPGGYTFLYNDPVDNWAHLVLNADEMRAALMDKVGTSIAVAEDVEPIVDSIYFSSTSNKKLPSEILRTLEKYFYLASERSEDGNALNNYYTLAAKNISEEDLRCSELTLFGRPKTDFVNQTGDVVSVIVPCYNVQSYVGECLDSILAQRDVTIELILVDDKSTDATLEILNRYAVHYNNIILCKHDCNLGLGPARNTGVAAAHGKYIFFLDSDDTLASDSVIADLVATMNEGEYPVVVGSCRKLLLNGKEEAFDEKQRAQWGGGINVASSGLQAFRGAYLLDRDSFIPMRAWGTLFESAFYKKHGFSFPAGTHEDLALIPFIYAMSDKVYYTSTVCVNYRERKNSLSNRPWSKANCVNASLIWAIIQRNLRKFSLEEYTSEVAVSILGHNTYKVITNGLESQAVEAFFESAQYIAAVVTKKIKQRQFDSIFYMIRSLMHIRPSRECYDKIIGCFNSENIIEFYHGDRQKDIKPLPIKIIEVPEPGRIERQRLFDNYDATCPPAAKKHPAMLTVGDRAIYYHYASQISCPGTIIDAGCFVGGTTHALIEGLKNNTIIRPEDKKVYVYDLFKIDEGYIRQWLQDIFGDEVNDELTSFRNFFDKMTASFTSMLAVHEGDICEIGYAYQQPIALLGLDCCKTLAVTDSVIRNFFPYLIPNESVVIHQDYIHAWHPYIHISMELLQEYFEPLMEVEWGGSYVWKCIKQITPNCIERIFGCKDTSSENQYSWYTDYERNDILLQKKQQKLFYPQNQLTLSFVRTIYSKYSGKADMTNYLKIETLEQYANYCSVDSLEESLQCSLELKQYIPMRISTLPQISNFSANGDDWIPCILKEIQAERHTGSKAKACALTALLVEKFEELQPKILFRDPLQKIYLVLKDYIKSHKKLHNVARKIKKCICN